jgi:hypothetical protein
MLTKLTDFITNFSKYILIMSILVLVASVLTYIYLLRSKIEDLEFANISLQKELVISQFNAETFKNAIERQNEHISALERESADFRTSLAKAQEEADSLIMLAVEQDTIITDSADSAIEWLREKHTQKVQK